MEYKIIGNEEVNVLKMFPRWNFVHLYIYI